MLLALTATAGVLSHSSFEALNDDGSDYTRRAEAGDHHIWTEPNHNGDGTSTGYWLQDALKGGDNPACLDGSAPLYYHRPGTGSGANKWYIHHQGGGWCGGVENCKGRAIGSLGSTNPAVSKDTPTMTMGGGYFSQDETLNPLMYNWNAVFLRYCDGGSFSGSNATAVPFQSNTSSQMWFRGKHILKAMQDDLFKNRGLAASTDVVISGCSAGGLATYLHVDNWADRLAAAAPTAKVRGMPDSGFFLDSMYGRAVHYHDMMQSIFYVFNSTSGVNQACIAANPGLEWKCIFAEHTSPHIKTPIFPLQAEYDSWQMIGDLGVNETLPESYPVVNAWGANLTALIHTNLLAVNPGHGVFLDSCLHHCGGWGDYTIDGMVQGPAFQQWYNTGKGIHIQGKPYPCLECCHPSN